MATLSVTHDFVPGTLAKADEVDVNFDDIVQWANAGQGGTVDGGIQHDNFGKLKGPFTWEISSSSPENAIVIDNEGDQSSVKITHSGSPDPNEAAVEILGTAARTASYGNMLLVRSTNAGSSSAAAAFEESGSGAAIYADNSGTGEAATLYANGTTNVSLTLRGTSTGERFRIFNSSATEAFQIAEVGTVKTNDITLTGTDVANSGPTLSRETDTRARINDELRIGAIDGPIFYRDAAGRVGLSDSMRIGDANGPVLSKNSNFQLNVANTILVNGGPELSNDSGNLNVSSAVFLDSGTALANSSGVLKVYDYSDATAGSLQLGDGQVVAKDTGGYWNFPTGLNFNSGAFLEQGTNADHIRTRNSAGSAAGIEFTSGGPTLALSGSDLECSAGFLTNGTIDSQGSNIQAGAGTVSGNTGSFTNLTIGGKSTITSDEAGLKVIRGSFKFDKGTGIFSEIEGTGFSLAWDPPAFSFMIVITFTSPFTDTLRPAVFFQTGSNFTLGIAGGWTNSYMVCNANPGVDFYSFMAIGQL